MTIELKPCPAGHDAEIVQHPDGTTYSPQCADWNCAWKIDEEFSDPETAAKFWNTRAEPEVIETGYMIVDENPPVVCYGVHDTINEAWEEFQGVCNNCREESMEDMKKRAEQSGCRAVRVKIVRVG